MASIRKEIPTGTIDWVNKVFVLANTPDFIDDIFFDGAIYTSFSLIWNILTLTDAPEYSLFVDYETWWSEPFTTTSITFWDIKSEVWRLLWQKSTSTTFSNEVVGDEINEIFEQIVKWRVTSKLDDRVYRAWKLWFIEQATSIRIKWGSALTAILNVWDTSLSCDTTNLLPSWYVEIWGEIVKYTWVTSTELTWISWNILEHNIGEAIVQLYELPTNLDKPEIVQKIIKWVQIRKSNIPLNNDDNYSIYYQLLRTWNTKLIKIVWLQNDDLVKITYTIRYSQLVNDSDVCILPDTYWKTVVAKIVAWGLWYDKWLMNAERILNSWYKNLMNMFQYFTNETNVIKQNISAKAFWFTSIKRMY